MFTVIYNPIAGNKKAKKSLPIVTDELKKRNIAFTTLETCRPANKEHYSNVPCGEDDTVCIVGGDGTVLNVLNMLPGRKMKLISVPCGTGNDFIKCLKLPKKPLKALRIQLDSKANKLDYAKANDEYYLNVFGTGFDVEVLKKLDLFKNKHSGLKAYLLAVVKAVKEYKPIEYEISVDGGEFIKKRASIVSVGNGVFIGGGMKAVPSAVPFDGYLDVVEAKPVKKRQLLLLLPSFVFGFHVKNGLGKSFRCKSLTIKGKNMSYQIDGEIRYSDKIEISIISNELGFGM